MSGDARAVPCTRVQALLDGVVDASVHRDARIRWTDGEGDRFGKDVPGTGPSRQEEQLVARACMGDDGALEALCLGEWYGVYSLVSALVVDVAEAEEITQEVFTRAIASLSRFRYVGVPFRSYLAQIARNLLKDRRRAALVGPVLVAEDQIPDRPASEPEPEAIVLAADERRLLVAALRRLPSRCREVLCLRLLEGRTAAEIGVEWGRTPESVRQIQHRALLALRSEMAGRAAR